MSNTATDLIQSFFDPGAVVRLAQAAGLEPEVAGRVLEAGLPLQIGALAEAAKTPDGEAMIAEAVGALPPFASVAEALEESGGADNLRQAGEMLAPVLMGEEADTLPARVSAQTQADPSRVQALLQMALPLLLSALGQRGLKAGNIAPMLAGLGSLELGSVGLVGTPGADAVATEAAETLPPLPVEPPETASVESVPEMPVEEIPVAEVPAEAQAVEPLAAERVPVESAPVAPEEAVPEAMPPEEVRSEAPVVSAESAPSATTSPETTPPDPSTPEGLLKYLQARFGGAVGQKIGAVAGFGGGVRKQAALAALPVVLAALVGKASGGGTGAGGDLDRLAHPFVPLTGEDGQVNTDLLDSPVEVARIEGQGRGLLAPLFGDVNAVTGRLGSALGGSGDSSRRLLAMLTPLVLSALTRAHAGGLGALPIAGLADGLKAALPSGFSSLGVLIGSLATGTPLPGAVSSTVQTTPRAAVQQGAPAAPPRPSPLKPPRPARFEKPAPPVAPPVRRRGFPLWLIPLLLLLLLGGCWVLQNRQPAVPAVPDPTTAPTTPGDSGTLPGLPVQTVFTEPQRGAAVPAGGFTLRGTGSAGEVVDVFLGDSKVGSATVDPDGTWSLDVGAAPQGPQTYTLKNAAGGEMAALGVVVGGADTAPADATPADADASGTAAPEGTAAGNTAPAAPAPDDSSGAASVVITKPAEGAQVPSGGLTLRGTGPAGEQFVLFHSGLRAGSVTVAPDGTWKADILAGAALPGSQRYDLRNAAGQVVARVRLQVAPSGQDVADGTSGGTSGNAGATPVGAGGVTVSSPASGAKVDGAGFALSGNGPAGQTFEVLEDGVSIGGFTVGADGTWTRQVPGPSAGAKTYVVRTADGQQVASVPVTVGAAPANAACAEALSVSLKDGETVTAPYRFGGVGGGDAYTITVKRGERTVGSKTVAVGAGCAWNFTSNPGSSAGQASTVTYEVRPANASPSDAPAARLTLNVR